MLGETAAPNALAVMDDMLRVMSAHVVVRPSRHEFFVDGADTILEAALRSGLALNYGCSNGNCGLCKARVVSGQVQKVRNQDYVLSEAEKQQGYTLLCSHTAVGDLVIEALESAEAGDIPPQQIVAQVKAIQALDEDLMLLHLQTPRSKRLRFLAGQNLTLTAGEVSAQLPIASCPCDDRNLHFHVARNAEDGFAQAVFSSIKAGNAVTLFGPWGDFVLRADSPRSILFLACDTGFAPIKSLLEHAMALEVSERLYLYWLATRPAGHYLANLCRSWADALDNFSYAPVAAGAADARELLRRIDADHSRSERLRHLRRRNRILRRVCRDGAARAGFPRGAAVRCDRLRQGAAACRASINCLRSPIKGFVSPCSARCTTMRKRAALPARRTDFPRVLIARTDHALLHL